MEKLTFLGNNYIAIESYWGVAVNSNLLHLDFALRVFIHDKMELFTRIRRNERDLTLTQLLHIKYNQAIIRYRG